VRTLAARHSGSKVLQLS